MANKEIKSTEHGAINLEESLNRTEIFFNKNKKSIIFSLIAIIVVIVGVYAYIKFVVEPKEREASEALFAAETLFVNGQFLEALEGNSTVVGFQELAESFKGTDAGRLANGYAGLCCAQLDSMQQASIYLARYGKGRDKMASPAILGALANCYASMDDLSTAAKKFEQAAKLADNALLTPYYLFQAGLVYEAMERPSQALKLYQTIKKRYPSSRESQTIEQYIVRLSSK